MTGDTAGALELLNAVLAIKPKEGEALYLKGLALSHQGDTTQAVELYQKALDISLSKGSK